MNQQSYKMLCDTLEQVTNEVFENLAPACDFSEDQDVVEFEQEFNLWSDR